MLFAGEDLTAADGEALTRYRRRHVGFVFQFPCRWTRTQALPAALAAWDAAGSQHVESR